MSTTAERKTAARKLAKEQGISFDKDYFALDSDEKRTIINLGKIMNYKSNSKIGRSYGQAFYYYLGGK